MPELLGPIVEGGSFALVAWLVVGQFRRLDQHMTRSAEREESTARILAELTLQVARITGASLLEVRESTKLARKESKA